VQPEVVKMIADLEEAMEFTIDNKLTVSELARIGKSRLTAENVKYVKQAINDYSGNIITDTWKLPAGAYGKGGGSI
jgi:hypothetical protein